MTKEQRLKKRHSAEKRLGFMVLPQYLLLYYL